ncbi:ABC transporter permease [Eshraghiella crossota]
MKRKTLYTFISIIIWLVLWQIISAVISSPVFLPSPLQTVNALFSLLKTFAYYKSLSYSLLNISIGFFTGLFAGVVLAVAASVNTFLQSVIDVPVKIIRSIPVASFIILALLWVDSAHLSTFIAAITIMPVIYTNTFSGIAHTDSQMKEMAEVFHFSPFKKLVYIYMPYVAPHFLSGVKLSCGFAWKSGIAAEIIGLVRHSIGNNIYKSKIYLETDNLFAWTISLIVLSIIFEKIVLLILNLIFKRIGSINDKAQ